jgi:hypothetical protein
VIVALCAAVAGLAAYLYYFAWSVPLLEPAAIERYAYGPQGINILEYEMRSREEDDGTLERILALVNEAPLSQEEVESGPEHLLVVLYRDDGLAYFLYQDGPRVVGISEGDAGYLGSLDSPELASLLAQIQAGER